jgi:hypothetical protein
MHYGAQRGKSNGYEHRIAHSTEPFATKVISEHNFSGQKGLPPGLYCTDRTKLKCISIVFFKNIGTIKSFIFKDQWCLFSRYFGLVSPDPLPTRFESCNMDIGKKQYKCHIPHSLSLLIKKLPYSYQSVYLLSRKVKSFKHFLHVMVQG